MYAIAVPSVPFCRLSVKFGGLKFSAIYFRRLVPWPFNDIHGKCYGDRRRKTPPSGGFKRKRGSEI